jgi:hypothetical protein
LNIKSGVTGHGPLHSWESRYFECYSQKSAVLTASCWGPLGSHWQADRCFSYPTPAAGMPIILTIECSRRSSCFGNRRRPRLVANAVSCRNSFRGSHVCSTASMQLDLHRTPSPLRSRILLAKCEPPADFQECERPDSSVSPSKPIPGSRASHQEDGAHPTGVAIAMFAIATR